MSHKDKRVLVSKAIQVYGMLVASDGKLTQRQACEKIGIDPETYRKFITQDPEALETLRQISVELGREELSTLLMVKLSLLNRLATQALSGIMDPKEGLEFMKYIDERTATLSEKYQTSSAAATKALQGPVLREVKSRFAPGTSPIFETEPLEDGSLNIRVVQPDVIDGELLDP